MSKQELSPSLTPTETDPRPVAEWCSSLQPVPGYVSVEDGGGLAQETVQPQGSLQALQVERFGQAGAPRRPRLQPAALP